MKIKMFEFSAGRGTSLLGIKEIETTKSLYNFTRGRKKEVNDENSKDFGNVRGSEDEAIMGKHKDGSYSVSHGTVDYDMTIKEGHPMWNVVDEEKLVKWGDNCGNESDCFIGG